MCRSICIGVFKMSDSSLCNHKIRENSCCEPADVQRILLPVFLHLWLWQTNTLRRHICLLHNVGAGCENDTCVGWKLAMLPRCPSLCAGCRMPWNWTQLDAIKQTFLNIALKKRVVITDLLLNWTISGRSLKDEVHHISKWSGSEFKEFKRQEVFTG